MQTRYLLILAAEDMEVELSLPAKQAPWADAGLHASSRRGGSGPNRQSRVGVGAATRTSVATGKVVLSSLTQMMAACRGSSDNLN